MTRDKRRATPMVGHYVEPDGWRAMGVLLERDDGYRDLGFPGCMFRMRSVGGRLAVNVIVTGAPRLAPGYSSWPWRSRCKIEFIQDGGAGAVTSGGWLYHNYA